MPDNEITLKDLYEKLVAIETILNKHSFFDDGDKIKGETDNDSPFFNPDTKLYDTKFYRSNQVREDK